jgi:phage terminase Nu1 subunit (DNA packaging protein)
MPLKSISELAADTEIRRATIRKRLKDLTPERGPNRSKLYNSAEALKAIYLGGADTYNAQHERARLDHHKANVEEMRAGKLRGELVELEAVGHMVTEMIGAARAKLLALPDRIAQSLPVPSEVRRQAQTLMRHEVYSALDELAEDHFS